MEAHQGSESMNDYPKDSLEAIKMFCVKKVSNYTSAVQDVFFTELAYWAASNVSMYKGLHGPQKTKLIRAFFRGMKDKENK